MTLLRRKLLAILALSPALMAQDSSVPSPKPLFFHGTITAIEGETITIFRVLVGHKPEIRKFIIKPSTNVNRRLSVHEDVTVRYLHSDKGDVALEIRVHSERLQHSS